MWTRDIRFFTVATALVLLYALGWYTPAFRAMYELLPGVSLFRRPADAAFPLVALIALLGGYLVHRWLAGTVPRANKLQHAAEIVAAAALIVVTVCVAIKIGMLDVAIIPIVTGIVLLWMSRRAPTLAPLPVSTSFASSTNRPRRRSLTAAHRCAHRCSLRDR